MSKKNAIVLKKNDNIIVSVEPPNEQMDLGKQINYFQEIVKQSASIGCTAAVINGVLLVKAQIEHPKTFIDWIDANTAVSQKTCYNYINAAKRTMGTQIVEELAKRGTMEIAEKVQQAMVKLRLESKPLTELYCDVGIIKKTPSKMGGKREGAGRPKKDEKREAVQGAITDPARCFDEVDGHLTSIYEICVTKNGFGVMRRDNLKITINTLNLLLTKAKEVGRVGEK